MSSAPALMGMGAREPIMLDANTAIIVPTVRTPEEQMRRQRLFVRRLSR